MECDVLAGTETVSVWQGSTGFGFEWPVSNLETPAPLAPPSPNPTRAGTPLRFDLPISSQTELTVIDIGGRKIRELMSARTSESRPQVRWDGRDSRGLPVASGVYIVRLEWPEGSATRRVTIAR